ncbi:hypothetical protein SKAU_G00254430 [Synaphobranchus kaupii]|uniref:Uncharacterized protein n=1 Tax=Synaphobranchus kaupii TaxID=118154 RepID=A0A9Q1F3I2_SYNKA|nr:hypothetical protein SKAU_G00254430 [Synaphobranchus kaupii]
MSWFSDLSEVDGSSKLKNKAWVRIVHQYTTGKELNHRLLFAFDYKTMHKGTHHVMAYNTRNGPCQFLVSIPTCGLNGLISPNIYAICHFSYISH